MDAEFYIDNSGEWRWRVTVTWPSETLRPKEILADSSEGYATQRECEADFVRLVKGLKGDANTVVIDNDGGKVVGSLYALVDMHMRAAR